MCVIFETCIRSCISRFKMQSLLVCILQLSLRSSSRGLSGDFDHDGNPGAVAVPIESSGAPFTIGNPLKKVLPPTDATSNSLDPAALVRISIADQATVALNPGLAPTEQAADGTSLFLSNPMHDGDAPEQRQRTSIAARPSVTLQPAAPGLKRNSSLRFGSSDNLQALHESRARYIGSPLINSARRGTAAPRSSSMAEPDEPKLGGRAGH